MKFLRALLTIPAFCLLQSIITIYAQPRTSSNPPNSNQGADVQHGEESFVRVELVPSQQKWTIGTRMGLLGKITNISSVPLLFRQNETGFISPTEARIYDKTQPPVGCVLFSTEYSATSSSSNAQQTVKEVTLQPHESYWVFWDKNNASCSAQTSDPKGWRKAIADWWSETLPQKINFQPGSYKFVLQTKFYEASKTGGSGTDIAHYASQDQDVDITASTGMILFGAVIGGLLGFLVKLLSPSNGTDQQVAGSRGGEKQLRWRGWEFILHALGACTLAVTVVILGSRLAATQFPFQVSVADFWGALTIGFFGYFGGFAVIQRMVEGVAKKP
jgi:hypothetical protein